MRRPRRRTGARAGASRRYWARAGLRPCYVRQTANETTGEHTAVLLREVRGAPGVVAGWSDAFVDDFRRRCSSLLGAPCFQGFPLALSLGREEEAP